MSAPQLSLCPQNMREPDVAPNLTVVLCVQHFPEKKHCAVPSGIDYLRLTPVDKLK